MIKCWSNYGAGHDEQEDGRETHHSHEDYLSRAGVVDHNVVDLPPGCKIMSFELDIKLLGESNRPWGSIGDIG